MAMTAFILFGVLSPAFHFSTALTVTPISSANAANVHPLSWSSAILVCTSFITYYSNIRCMVLSSCYTMWSFTGGQNFYLPLGDKSCSPYSLNIQFAVFTPPSDGIPINTQYGCCLALSNKIVHYFHNPPLSKCMGACSNMLYSWWRGYGGLNRSAILYTESSTGVL